jgi:hypothetical protein
MEATFDQRMDNIKSILQKFKADYFDKETQNILNNRDLKPVYLRFTMYTEPPLKSYLNNCLANESVKCEEHTIESIVSQNSPVEHNYAMDDGDNLIDQPNANGAIPDVTTLLKTINTYMFPWDSRLNAEVGALFASFIDHPFSMNLRSDKKEHVTLN